MSLRVLFKKVSICFLISTSLDSLARDKIDMIVYTVFVDYRRLYFQFLSLILHENYPIDV